MLDRLTENPERPYAVVLGGSKVSDKLGVISHLLPRVDRILVGGGMLFTFLKAQEARWWLRACWKRISSRRFAATSPRRPNAVSSSCSPPMSSSPHRSARTPAHEVAAADAIESTPVRCLRHRTRHRSGDGSTLRRRHPRIEDRVLERPDGVFEFPAFAAGTKTVAQALTEVDGLSVVGGGDSAAAVRQLGFTDDQFGHISTGGGASLEFLEGKKLPGLEVLDGV